ncbi:uncharacterized protein LOC128551077 [Mercenaria mercenaria]|uniref:uncharacterized protein LOC128551077 n=1 Tax=Mercenaria mercenaria TaxID=6596 RepID=UPI00234EC9E5|nr:uncharacterized protein LOC128551077 [Mercenaria mercenaria]
MQYLFQNKYMYYVRCSNSKCKIEQNVVTFYLFQALQIMGNIFSAAYKAITWFKEKILRQRQIYVYIHEVYDQRPRIMLLFLRMRYILHYCTKEDLAIGLSNDWPVIVMSIGTTRAKEDIRDVVNDIFHDWQLSRVIYILLSRRKPHKLDVSHDIKLSELQTILYYWIYDRNVENSSLIKTFWNNTKMTIAIFHAVNSYNHNKVSLSHFLVP